MTPEESKKLLRILPKGEVVSVIEELPAEFNKLSMIFLRGVKGRKVADGAEHMTVEYDLECKNPDGTVIQGLPLVRIDEIPYVILTCESIRVANLLENKKNTNQNKHTTFSAPAMRMGKTIMQSALAQYSAS